MAKDSTRMSIGNMVKCIGVQVSKDIPNSRGMTKILLKETLQLQLLAMFLVVLTPVKHLDQLKVTVASTHVISLDGSITISGMTLVALME